MFSVLLLLLMEAWSVFPFHSSSSVTQHKLESTCGDGSKQSLHLNNPAVFTFNSTVRNKKFSCHLELHLHSQSLGFSVFIETLQLSTFMNSDCGKDSLQFGRDKLFITTHTSPKYCQNIEQTQEVRDPETGSLLEYDFRNVSYARREYVEDEDNEMDVWFSLEPGLPDMVKTIKLVVVPFRKSCNFEDEKYYRRCPGSGRCFKKEYFCSGMVKCDVLSESELGGSCIKETETSGYFYLPIIIIVTVVIIIATVVIGFGIKLLIKHFNDNGVHNIEPSQRASRSCNVMTSSSPALGTALLTPEREQRRPDSQEIPLSTAAVTVKHTAPPSYEEVFGSASKDEPPKYQDIVEEEPSNSHFQ